MRDLIEVEFPHFSKSPNGTPKITKKNAIVIHDTGGNTVQGTLGWFLSEESKVSSHYLIAKTGEIYHGVPDEYVAWHAGKSILHGRDYVNNFAIGIELVDDNDNDPYPDDQMESLIDLCEKLCIEHVISLNRIVGHKDIAIPAGRKVDPGKDFPWYEFLNTIGARIAAREINGDEP